MIILISVILLVVIPKIAGSNEIIAEKKPVTEGAPGHGCGHNLFGASSATAAIATAMAMEKHGINGTIRFYGTPGEEAGGGKVFMAREGLWEVLLNKILANVGDSNVTLIGAPPFTEKDQAFGKQISLVLKKMGINGIEAPYYDTEIQHPDLSGNFPDVPLGRYSTDSGKLRWIIPCVQFQVATLSVFYCLAIGFDVIRKTLQLMAGPPSNLLWNFSWHT